MAVAPEIKKLAAKSTKREVPSVSKAERNLLGRKPLKIVGETWLNGILWHIVQLERSKAAILLKHELVLKKYPQMLKKTGYTNLYIMAPESQFCGHSQEYNLEISDMTSQAVKFLVLCLLMASFVSVYKHMFGGQFVIRIFSFILNFALLRLIDPSLLGFFNVKMTLLYNTICFLSREPIRRLCLSSDFELHKVPLYASLSPVRCSPWPPGRANALIVAVFSFSALAETFVEPSIVRQLKMGNTAEYARNNAILVLSQKVIAFLAVLIGLDPLLGFPIAQLIGSILFVCLYAAAGDPSDFLCILRPFSTSNGHKFESGHLKLLGTFICHSVLKQTLTDGANYLMSFTDLLPLKMQAVYDAVERLGSLAVRLVLQPFEESASIYFGTQIRRAVDNNGDGGGGGGGHSPASGNGEMNTSEKIPTVPRPICEEFVLLTRHIVTFGLVVLAFGSSFCWLAAFLYGGRLFIDNGADDLLFWYSIYLPVIAVNGISECFVVATLSVSQVLLHARFFFLSVCVHLPLSYALCFMTGARGFVMANLAAYSLRVAFNWRFIHRTLGAAQFGHGPNVYRQLVPGKKFILLLLLSWLIVSVSHNFLGQTLTFLSQVGHLFIGASMFCLTAFAFFAWEHKTPTKKSE
uniref:Protein RFT1 homolog n=1 Tax=Globodera rostochiensis TaxID=31243 RepID=A0A914I3Y0_GLORO